MPARLPVFRPPGWQERKAWAPRAGRKAVERKRGRAGQRDRRQVIEEEPFCRLCLAQDTQRPTDVVDHIVPLAWGGPDERWNKQGLCNECHDAKSLRERLEGPPADLGLRVRRLKNQWLASAEATEAVQDEGREDERPSGSPSRPRT
jgi:5-methylcytosine-specific restriction protein A